MNIHTVRSPLAAAALTYVAVTGCLISNVHAASAPQIYWSGDGTKILRADLDGTNMTTVVSDTQNNMGDFVIDRRTSKIYWDTGFRIYRSNLDGTAITGIFDFPSFAFEGDITIDPVTNALFFVDGRNNAIYRSNLDGTGATTIVPAHGTPSNGGGVMELSLDSSAGKLYWNDKDSIRRINLDGSQDELLFSGASGIDDFEIDPQQGKIYWAATSGAQNGGAIRRANLNGTQQQTLVGNLWWADGIALDLAHGKMYYTDGWYSGPTNYNGTIRVANLDGTSQQTLINLGSSVLSRPREITLDTALCPNQL
jgi:hypothetical protein